MKCRECNKVCDILEQHLGVFWIPQTDQYFKLLDLRNRSCDMTKTLFYCVTCFQQRALQKYMSRFQCAYCHI